VLFLFKEVAVAASKDYLHPNWQKKRLEILERDNFTCTQCGATEETLNVHHSHYVRGRKIWEYENCTLITFCDECHKAKHSDIKAIDPMKVQRLLDLYYDFENYTCDIKSGLEDRQFYMECIMQAINEDEHYIIASLVDDEPECDEHLNNFTILEALLYHKIRMRNVKKYTEGCLMITGGIMKPSDIGKESLSVSRYLQRSVF
jgi:hypothetical protein